MKAKPSEGLFCVCDPDGDLVHTAVATSAEDAIEFFMDTERTMNDLCNAFATVKGRPLKCFSSWEGFEAEGYRIVSVNLIPNADAI